MTKKIYIYGVIGDETLKAKDIIAEIREAESIGADIVFKMNTPGGSVFEGFAVYNVIKKYKYNTLAEIDGVCASMGTIIMAACKQISISRHARIMIHRPQMSASGDSSEMRNASDFLATLDPEFERIYANLTGKSLEYVRENWLAEGKDVWFTPNEALVNGLVDFIYDADEITPVSAEMTDLQKVYAHYQPQLNIVKQNPSEMKNTALFALAFAKANITLGTDANEETILQHVQAVVAKLTDAEAKLSAYEKENKELKDAAKAQELASVKAYLDAAVESGRIVASERVNFEKLSATDFESVKAIVDARPVRRSIQSQLGTGSNVVAEERKAWTWDDWSKKDPQGLGKLKAEQFEMYSQLFKAKFNVEPSK